MSEASALAEVGGVRLHYLEWQGGAPPVLCLHGITANAHAFAGLAEALSPRHRVIAMDLRGRGESDKPGWGYDVGTHVADALGLLDVLHVDRASVVGWSLGAKIALALAAMAPERVERAVLVDPPVETPPAALEWLRAFWARLDNTYASVEEFLALMRASPVFASWSPYVERYLRADVQVGADGVVRHRVARSVPDQEIDADPRYPTRSFYERVRCPVLVLRAPAALRVEGDQVLRPEQGREMAERIRDCRVLEVEGANHITILLGKPPATIAAIRPFLATEESR